MKWIDLTDALFCRAFDHTFVIHKEVKMGVVEWAVINHEGNEVVYKGSTYKVTPAKAQIKEIYDQIKADYKAKNIFYRKNNKLVRRK